VIITKLKNSSYYKQLLNNFFLVALDVVILLYSFDYYLCFILLGVYNIYIFKRNKNLYKIMFFLLITISLVYLIYRVVIRDKGYSEVTGIVMKIEEKEGYNKLIIKKGIYKVIVYDYSFAKLDIGDKIYAKGENKKIIKNSNEYEFNYFNYLISDKTVSIIKGNVLNVKSSVNIYLIRKYIYKYIDRFDDLSSSYIKALVFGDTSVMDEGSKEEIQINGISHLFAISGLHISLIISILETILKKLFKNNKELNIKKIICVCLGVYMILTYFAISVLRAIFMYYLKVINEKYRLKLSSLDIISIILILFILVNPLIVYNISFKLSFLASFIIILLSQTLKIYNIKLKGIYSLMIMTIVVQIGTFPIVINMGNTYNVFSIITNIIFVNLITYIILPFSFIVVLLPFFSDLYKYTLISFEKVNSIFANDFVLNIDIPSFSNFEIIMFYLLLILLLMYRNKKIILFSICFIIIFWYKADLNVVGKVSFLSLYEGDAIVIDLPFNDGIVIIDTGTGQNETLSSYLKAKGIRNIDYLVLTHNHLDHNGEAKTIISNFNVSNIIVHAYDNSVYSKLENSIKFNEGDSFTCNGYVFRCINPSIDTNDENNNALVFETSIGGLNYLFLSDISKEIEEKLIPSLKIDIVKVGHHGSKTSSSEEFYQRINPEYVIITPGDNLKYGFPHQEALDVLEKYKVYRTDLHKQINVNFFKNKSIITTVG